MSGEFITHLLTAKTKVAPIKVHTLPRRNSFGENCVFTSYGVESYQTGTPCHWPTFVANRVSYIGDQLGADNLESRGIST